jgi:murein DD-endopeptidase MepM/ murein hydrolase activator NlpD
MDSFFSRHLHVGLMIAGAIAMSGCTSDPVVWPVSGDAAGDWTLLTTTYGPRIRPEDGTYEFNRGIDIEVPERTDVHSIASGTVQLIEQITEEGGMRVQVAHDGFVSNYMHLLKVDASVGDFVDAGDYIATSGTSTDGHAHLHFEIRQPGTESIDCVHPFRVLPYFDRGAPRVTIDHIDMTNPLAPRVTMKVVVRNRELDLVRISAATFEAPQEAILDGLSPLSEQSWDMEQWNREKSADSSTELALLHDPLPNGIEVLPEPFDNASTEQTIAFTFTKLVGPIDMTHLRLRVEAEDVSGNVALVYGP